MIRAIREDGEIFKVLFLRKEVLGLLTRKTLCFEIANELSKVKPVRNNAAETVLITLHQYQKENQQHRNTMRFIFCWRLLLYQSIIVYIVKLFSFWLICNIHFWKSHCHFKTQDAITMLFINYFKYLCRQKLFTLWLL